MAGVQWLENQGLTKIEDQIRSLKNLKDISVSDYFLRLFSPINHLMTPQIALHLFPLKCVWWVNGKCLVFI